MIENYIKFGSTTCPSYILYIKASIPLYIKNISIKILMHLFSMLRLCVYKACDCVGNSSSVSKEVSHWIEYTKLNTI